MKDRHFLQDVVDSIGDGRLVLFIGAGVSAGLPSCLPLSKELKERIVRCLLTNVGEIGQEYLKERARELSDKCNNIMLEKLLQILYSTIDNRALHLLEVFDAGKPNYLHRFVAALMRKRLVTTVFTTNFDRLLEKACLNNGTRFKTWVSDNDFVVSKVPSIYKLHGCIEKKDTLAATLERVETLSSNKARVLVHFLGRSDFLFLGWSDDDLDVSPILLQNGARRFFWVRHSRDKESSLVVDWRDISPESRVGIDRLIMKHRGKMMKVHTEEFANELSTMMDVSIPSEITLEESKTKERISKVLDSWIEGISVGDRFLIIGDILAFFGWSSDAKSFHEEALQYYRERDDKPGLFIANIHLGEFYEALGNLERAESHYRDAGNLAEESRGKLGIAITLYKQAMLHHRRMEYEQALSKYEQCRRVSDSLGNVLWVANSLHQAGIVHETLGDLENAISMYSQSARLRKGINDIEGWVASQAQLASSYAMTGTYKEADSILEETTDVLRKIGNAHGAAILLHKQGHMYQLLGRYDESLDLLSKSLVIKKEVGSEEDIAETQHQLAIVLMEKDKLEQAMDVLQDVLRIRRKYQDEKGIGQVLHEIGMIQERRSDLTGALVTYERSIRYQRLSGYRRGIGQTLHQKGIVLWRLNRFDDALESFQQSLRIRKEVADKEGEASTYHQIGMVYHERLRRSVGKADKPTLHDLAIKALSFYEKAFQIRKETGNPLRIAESLGQVGIFYYETSRIQEAIEALGEAKRIFAELDSPHRQLMDQYLTKIHSERRINEQSDSDEVRDP